MSFRLFATYKEITITIQIKKNQTVQNLRSRLVERFNQKNANIAEEQMAVFEKIDEQTFSECDLNEVLKDLFKDKQQVYLRPIQDFNNTKNEQEEQIKQQELSSSKTFFTKIESNNNTTLETENNQEKKEEDSKQDDENQYGTRTRSQRKKSQQQQEQQQQQQQQQQKPILTMQSNSSVNKTDNNYDNEASQEFFISPGENLKPINKENNNSNNNENDMEIEKKKLLETEKSPDEIDIYISFPQQENPGIYYEFRALKTQTLDNFSRLVAHQYGLKQEIISIFYDIFGNPKCSNLKEYNDVEIENCFQPQERIICIFNQSSIPDKLPELDCDQGSMQIFVQYQKPLTVMVDPSTTVQQLKQKVQKKSGLKVYQFYLLYEGKKLKNEITLQDYNIKKYSTVKLEPAHFPSQGMSSSLGSLGIVHLNSLKNSDLRILRSMLYMMCRNCTDGELQKMLGLFRDITQNNAPFVKSFYSFMKRNSQNFCEQVALEEGFYQLFARIACKTKNLDISQIKSSNIFQFTTEFLAIIYKYIREITVIPEYYKKREYFLEINLKCGITYKEITEPIGYYIDAKNLRLGDRNRIQAKIQEIEQKIQQKKDNGETIEEDLTMNLERLQKINYIEQPYLQEAFIKLQQSIKIQTKCNSDSLKANNQYYWIPDHEIDIYNFNSVINYDLFLPENWRKEAVQYLDSLTFFKIHPPMTLRSQNPPCLTKNKNNEIMVYTYRAKCVDNPLNILDIMSQHEFSTNPDSLSTSYGQNNDRNMVQSSGPNLENMDVYEFQRFITSKSQNLLSKPQITREPSEAIVVLIDISYSMGSSYQGDLERIGAIKAFFSAFADRTMAYDFNHVVSLMFFNNKTHEMCGFTELFTQFKELVKLAQPGYTTRLYDSLDLAVDRLLEFRLKYPNCSSRIICLTDGEDTESKKTTFHEVGKKICLNKILLDSFVVGDNCDELKALSQKSGGKCFYPETLDQGLRYFEVETILSSRIRENQAQNIDIDNLQQELNDLKDNKPFDQEMHKFKLPEKITKQVQPTEEAIKSVEKSLVPLSQRLRRIVRELEYIQKNPHPNISVWPCQEDMTFWKLVLIGSDETPYAYGKFVLYLQFPENYPNVPPDIRFTTEIYHCNINSSGRICHSILDRNYTTDTRVKEILDSVFGLLLIPEPEDPLDSTIASEYLQSKDLYQLHAQQATQKHAIVAEKRIVDQIIGQKKDDQEYAQKSKQLKDWMKDIIKNMQNTKVK